ncbi:hypothetical protein [Synechococcus sp. BS56D]|uniref:hypothetical protein n=1 Tax=Synechococcus sp. BS56D TaxID=2055944 RepID=UPI001386F43E|nr:hypothetical protein [Synechococcus sp. BS56D]
MALTLYGGQRTRASMPRWCYEYYSSTNGFEVIALLVSCLSKQVCLSVILVSVID